MTIIKLKGGLGNQLFQYAFGLALANKRREGLKLDNGSLGSKQDTYRSYSLDNFNVSATLVSAEELLKFKPKLPLLNKICNKIFRNYHIGYEANMLNTKKSYLEGFFQSYKYLELSKEQLLKEIVLIDDKFQDFISEASQVNSVSVHIRRGDYVSDDKTKKAHFICTLDYYKKAFDLIKEKVVNPVFYIFSDDIAWARENLSTEDNLVFVSKPEIKDYEELVLMSKCQHNIIANSSFSFWGAWLNQNPEKIVVAPAKWNNEFPQDYKDLLPPNWLKINID